MFDDLKGNSNEEIKENGDKLGGGGIFDSNAYELTVQAAYAGQAASGARSVTVELKDITGRSFKTTQWVTSGTAKGGKNYYEKDGEKHYLPGYELINALANMTAGKSLPELTIEKKVLKLWDTTAKAEIPQEVPCLVELHGQKVYLGILKVLVNKQVKDDNGNYNDTAETREINEVDRVFHYPSKKTMTEARAKAEPEFFDKWVTKNAGQVKNKVKEVAGGSTGKPARASATGTADSKPSSLFG